MTTVPLVVLDLGVSPRTGNRALRQHWAVRRREARDWALRVLAAWQTAPLLGLRFQGSREGLLDSVLLRPHLEDRRRVVVRWTAPQPPDKSRALAAVDPIIDCLQLVRRKKLGRGKKGYRMVEVPGVVPIWT